MGSDRIGHRSGSANPSPATWSSPALPAGIGFSHTPARYLNLGSVLRRAPAFQLIGLLELAGSAGLLIGLYWGPLGVAAAAGLVLLILGAVTTHLRRKDPVKVAAPAVLYAVASVAVLVLRLTTA